MISRELDEAQGLTVEMFRQYLQRSGWTKAKAVAGVTGYVKNRVWVYDLSLADAHNEMSQVARVEGLGVQALLREISPRMRKGMPSVAAIETHRQTGGMWIGAYGDLGDGGFIVFVCFHAEDSEQEGILAIWDDEEWHNSDWQPEQIQNDWSFWPCDAHGNKVRWPEKYGVML